VRRDLHSYSEQSVRHDAALLRGMVHQRRRVTVGN
jgi:hypothetical protein